MTPLATRRGLLGASAAAAALAGAGTTAAVASSPVLSIARPAPGSIPPDAELLRLGALLTDAWLLESQAYAAEEATSDANGIAAEAMERTSRVACRILDLPAKTLSGLLVKLRVFLWTHDGEPFKLADIYDDPDPSMDIRILGSIITDLSAMGSAPL